MTPKSIRKLRVAVIGAGYFGRFYAEQIHKSSIAELTAVVDTDLEKGRALAAISGSLFFSNIRELRTLELDCAAIVTPACSHAEIAKCLLDQDIDVLVEKPLAVSAAHARELTAFALTRRRLLQVGSVERFNSGFIEITRHVRDPKHVEMHRVAPYSTRGTDVDVILDLMIHDIDLIAQLIQAPITHIDAVGTRVITSFIDAAHVRIEFADGAIAFLSASRVAEKAERSIQVYQENSHLMLDLRTPALTEIFSKKIPGESTPKVAQKRSYPLAVRNSLADQLESFFHCVAKRGAPYVQPHEAVQAIEIAEWIHEAMKKSTYAEAVDKKAVNLPWPAGDAGFFEWANSPAAPK